MKMRMELVDTHAPWQAVLIPVSGFPVPKHPMRGLATFLGALRRVLTGKHNMQQQVYLQVWKLSPGDGIGVLNQNITAWEPEMGFGVWPDRALAGSWNEEMMVNSAAAVMEGKEPELPSYRLLHVTSPPVTVGVQASEAMGGLGALIEGFSRKSYEDVTENGNALFVPKLPPGPFGSAAFFLPLLDGATLAAAREGSMLDTWMCGLEVYVRESAEDGSILMVSRLPLEGLLAEVEGEMAQAALGSDQ